MSTAEELEEWAVARGINFNGVKPHIFPGSGLGMVATRALEADDILVTAPLSIIRTAETVPTKLKLLGISTINGLLATDLALDKSDQFQLWKANLPKLETFKQSLPIMWPEPLQELLPQGAWETVEKQKKKVYLDWMASSPFLQDLTYEEYLYYWLCVSTRTFYWMSDDPDAAHPPDSNDRLAIVPFADYFNHTDDEGCKVKYSEAGYEIITNKKLEPGEEIYLNYGSHSNDFLLGEYGFILDENRWDEICLDDVLLPLFSDKQKRDLEDKKFLGDYMLDDNYVCYRTQIAMRRLSMSFKKWQEMVAKGMLEDESDIEVVNKSDRLLLGALESYLELVDERLQDLIDLDVGTPQQRSMLAKRWMQIGTLLSNVIDSLK